MTNQIDLDSANLPYGDLPSADNTLLVDPPLEVAVVEVRFTAEVSDLDVGFATRIRDALEEATEEAFPIIQPAKQGMMQINFSDTGASFSQDATSGWQIAKADRSTAATIFANSVTLQVGDYRRWSESIGRPLHPLVRCLQNTLRPTLCHRIGLRFVNRFTDESCESLDDWSGKIADSLMAPVRNDVFGAHVRGTQSQIEIALGQSQGAILRHGPIADGTHDSLDYLLDIDVFSETTNEFSEGDIQLTASRLNRTALTLFQASLTREYLIHLQPRGVE